MSGDVLAMKSRTCDPTRKKTRDVLTNEYSGEYRLNLTEYSVMHIGEDSVINLRYIG